jgi:hypothetical protein
VGDEKAYSVDDSSGRFRVRPRRVECTVAPRSMTKEKRQPRVTSPLPPGPSKQRAPSRFKLSVAGRRSAGPGFEERGDAEFAETRNEQAQRRAAKLSIRLMIRMGGRLADSSQGGWRHNATILEEKRRDGFGAVLKSCLPTVAQVTIGWIPWFPATVCSAERRRAQVALHWIPAVPRGNGPLRLGRSASGLVLWVKLW